MITDVPVFLVEHKDKRKSLLNDTNLQKHDYNPLLCPITCLLSLPLGFLSYLFTSVTYCVLPLSIFDDLKHLRQHCVTVCVSMHSGACVCTNICLLTLAGNKQRRQILNRPQINSLTKGSGEDAVVCQ